MLPILHYSIPCGNPFQFILSICAKYEPFIYFRALSLNNLAVHYEETDRLSDAEPLLKRALQIHETTFPAAHSNTATALSNLAGLYQAQKRLAEAEPVFKRALVASVSLFARIRRPIRNGGCSYQAQPSRPLHFD